MVKPLEVLAIVQARGGSKGLPRKNVRRLAGHPLVAYSIATGLAARQVTRVVMSTDDEEIADVARAYGAEVPFLRPVDFATDAAPDFPLFAHALEWLWKHEQYRPEVVVQLRPTTPFRKRGMVDGAIAILLGDPKADCVRGVTTPKQTPYKMWRDGQQGYLAPLMDTEFAEPYNMPRQHLPAVYFQTGHVDAIRTATITEQHSLTGKLVRPIMIEPQYCVDIDTADDFELAERTIVNKNLQIDVPRLLSGAAPRCWPNPPALVVFDFDGVMTDNRVLVLQNGEEAVLCNRSDGMGLSRLRQAGIEAIVLSTEVNPVVQARCRKLGLTCLHGLEDKAAALREVAQARQIELGQVVYVGNDANDLGCMRAAGFAVAVADAHWSALEAADFVLSHNGGFGAVREVCDLILQQRARTSEHDASD